ncbi:hypothetical protein WJX72_007590 [[Myrmecia] bisecta]|uniref:Uncharacterized protein n=1 Tax=[Myrmecia] bisecta TaxID=41462 RepID=A0AAW1QRF9_9CHLO
MLRTLHLDGCIAQTTDLDISALAALTRLEDFQLHETFLAYDSAFQSRSHAVLAASQKGTLAALRNLSLALQRLASSIQCHASLSNLLGQVKVYHCDGSHGHE